MSKDAMMVCLDGTKDAEEILPIIRDLSGCVAGVITLFMSIDEPTLYTAPTLPADKKDGGVGDMFDSKAGEEQLKALGYLETIAGPLREEGLSVKCSTGIGKASKAIISYAREKDVKIIAIATKGRAGLKRWLFGSVADEVLRDAGRPVLILKSRQQGKK
jgi:nucleotide-binding universal stress UspA family protein